MSVGENRVGAMRVHRRYAELDVMAMVMMITNGPGSVPNTICKVLGFLSERFTDACKRVL